MLSLRQWVSGILVVGLLVVAAGYFYVSREPRAAAPKGAAPVPVVAAPVRTKTVPVRVFAIGNLEPYTTVAVKARIDGQIVDVRFREGDEVRSGDVLFQIDPRPYAASLSQAQANLGKDKALLDRALEQEKRYQDLLAKNFISKDAYDQVATNRDTAAATLRGDDAAVENARLSLEFATIRAPVTGYAGKIMIQQGNLVKANDANPLVTINQVVPIYASFSVPEQNVATIRAQQGRGGLRVTASLPNSTHPPIAGRISFVDNSADLATGTIRLKAEFPNTDKALWPGQFVNVALTLDEMRDAIVAPATAIQNGPNGAYAYVVRSDMTVDLRPLKVLRTDGDDAVIGSGLAPGESVVTVGQLRLSPGAKVNPGKGGPAS